MEWIRIVFYLRDMLFLEQGKELPMDNVDWNKLRPDDLLTQTYKENTEEDNPNLPKGETQVKQEGKIGLIKEKRVKYIK